MAGSKKGGRKKSYYERQKMVTERHKSSRATKRAKKLAYWLAEGVKKNGKKVLTLEERKVRAAARKVARKARRAIARADQTHWERTKMYNGRRRSNNGFRPIRPKKSPEADEES